MRQAVAVDLMTKTMIHHENTQAVHGCVQAKVELESINGHRTVAEFATRDALHHIQIAARKHEAVEKLANLNTIGA